MIVEYANKAHKIQSVWFVIPRGTCMNTDHKKQVGGVGEVLATAPVGHYAVRYR